MPLKANLSIIVGLAFAATALGTETLLVVGWNVESGGAAPEAVAKRIEGMNGIDLWGLCEVKASWRSQFETAAEEGEGADFQTILGTTGGGDRLLIIYDADKLERLDKAELQNINIGGHVRAPLVGRFRIRSTGDEFLFVVNHLYRTREDRRHEQATLLNTWGAEQELSVIAVGDYNFDWAVSNGDNQHDAGFDNLTADNVFQWVRPATLIRTQFSGDRPNRHSVLDFVFIANAGTAFTATSEIRRVPNDFPDTNATPDHRPVAAQVVWLSGIADNDMSTRDRLLERLERIESELAELKALVQEMDE